MQYYIGKAENFNMGPLEPGVVFLKEAPNHLTLLGLRSTFQELEQTFKAKNKIIAAGVNVGDDDNLNRPRKCDTLLAPVKAMIKTEEDREKRSNQPIVVYDNG